MLIINSDFGTAKLCHKVKEPHNCSNLTDLIIRNTIKDGTKIVQFAFIGDLQVYGELKIMGKRVISIKSCHGDIIINSTDQLQVYCSDSNGNRTDCQGTKSCKDCENDG